MSELSIKINIANRVYPLTIKREEEEAIRRTAKMINDKIKAYESDYAVKDKQDLLAMCVLEMANHSENAQKEWSELDDLRAQVKALNETVRNALQSH